MTREIALLLVSLMAACTGQQHDATYFKAHVNQVVKLVGRKATTEWQHMVTSIPGKRPEYIDLDKGHHQVVAHFETPPDCSGDIVMEGRVFEVRGPSKAALRGEPGMAGDEFWEHAVDVLRWHCD